MNLKTLTKIKNYVINDIFIAQAVNLNLSLDEFLLLVYFSNTEDKVFDIEKIITNIKLTDNKALEAFNKLIEKKLIVVETKKDAANKLIEIINMDAFYSLIVNNIELTQKESTTIYSQFEKEFGRVISSMEYEIINAWLDKGFSEEMILGALKEAIYNGVSNLRYIDKILYEWQRKGFKNMKEVNSYLENRSNQKKEDNSKELFDYNWLDDEE